VRPDSPSDRAVSVLDPLPRSEQGLPSGTVTFLLTDVEGSTALWEQAPEAMRAALGRHDALFEQSVQQHGGIHIRPRGEGDSRFAVFPGAADARSVQSLP
jgi:class 3 adenylate cyclase